MNSNSFDLRESSASAEPENVPTWKRILAFTMDMILLVVLLQLLVQFLPNAYSDQVKQEFNQLIIDASLLSQEEQSDLQRTTEFLEKSQLSEETYEMLMAMIFLPVSYQVPIFLLVNFFSVDKPWGRQPFVLEPHP